MYLLHERPTSDGWMKAKGWGGEKGKKMKKGMSYSAHARPSCPVGSSHSRAPVWASSFFYFQILFPFFSSISLSFFLGVSLFLSTKRIKREGSSGRRWTFIMTKRIRKQDEENRFIYLFFFKKEKKMEISLFSIFRGWKWNSLRAR